MRLMTIAASTFVLSLGAAALSLPASAEETGTLSSCVKLGEQVNQALAANSQSSSYDAAAKEKGYGRDYCGVGLYPQGVEHYNRALKLLGAESAQGDEKSSAS